MAVLWASISICVVNIRMIIAIFTAGIAKVFLHLCILLLFFYMLASEAWFASVDTVCFSMLCVFVDVRKVSHVHAFKV